MSSYTISGSDKEIINALTIAEGIRKECVSNSSLESSWNLLSSIDESGNSERTASITSNDSSHFKGTFYHGNDSCDSLKFDAEFQTVSQDVQTVYLMNDLFIDRKNTLENENKVYIKEILSAQEILSESILNKRLESINLVVKHILRIANQVSRIKQALQDEPSKSTLKVSPSCQEGVVQFFDTADAIIKKMLEDANVIEFSDKNFTKVIPINEMALHSKLQSIITGLARRLDIITEFRNHSLTTEELESGIELGISELGKSEPPKLIFEQISTNDSGLNSSLNPE